MDARRLGRAGPAVSPIGFGAFKIGRNVGIKYPQGYELPDEQQVSALLHGVLDLGINYIDTAPAYGSSEQWIGRVLASRRDEFVLSSKVGETFEDGQSTYDFSADAVDASLQRSLERLGTDRLDAVFIHSNGEREEDFARSGAVASLRRARERGVVNAIGLSAKTIQGARSALDWADVLMVEYPLNDRSFEPILVSAVDRGVGIVCKKGLASGHLSPIEAIRFVLRQPAIASLVVGSLNLAHLEQNLRGAGCAGMGEG